MYVAGRRERGWSYRFNVQNLAAGVRLTSAYLWLHKTRDVSTTSGGSSLTLTVQSVYADDDDDDDVSKSRTRRYQLSWTSGWVQVGVVIAIPRFGIPGSRFRIRFTDWSLFWYLQ